MSDDTPEVSTAPVAPVKPRRASRRAVEVETPEFEDLLIATDDPADYEIIRLHTSDGLQGLTGPDHVYDLILCNPPYVNSASMAALPAEYQAEPVLALAGGDDGMDFIRNLLHDAPSRMREHAVLVLEIGNERDYFEAAFPTLEVVWLETSAGYDQVLLVTREALLYSSAAAPSSRSLA